MYRTVRSFCFAFFFFFPLFVLAQTVQTQHVRPQVASGRAQPVGRLASEKVLQLDLVLPLRNEAGLESLLSDLYDPTSPSYHHFLSVQQFTEQFGPTAAEYQAVVNFARQNGMTVVGGSRDGMDVQVSAPVSVIESAFRVNMRTYQHPTEDRTYYAPDSEPVVGVSLWHISGLDNYSKPKPRFSKRSDDSTASGTLLTANTKFTSNATTGSGPSASYLGSDMRAAYYGGSALTGAGQNAGLLEYYGTNLTDLNTYLKNTGQTNSVPVTLLSVDGTSTTCNYSSSCDDTEQILDITQILGMAPGLNSLVVYTGSSDTAILSAMTSHSPLPTTIGCSWGWTPVDQSTLDPYFKKMAAQGQSFFAASGDSATWSSTNEAWPADDPYVTAVGGTDLVTASAAGAWQSETAWSNSGGGISPDNIAIPSWQQYSGVINSSNKGSSVYRNGPDVSANANYTFYVCADQTTCTANAYGGTSFAAPMWAGYIALVNQQLAAAGGTTIGFLNPTLYALNITSAYSTDFHDVTSGTAGSYSATTGYDLVTGWGSPNGVNLINALVSSAATSTFSLAASATSLTVARSSQSSLTLTTTALNGFSSAVALSASGQPSGVTVSFSSSTIASPGAGTATVTFATGSTVAAGSYPITLTATGGGVTKSLSVTLVVSVTATFTLTPSATSLSVMQGSKSTLTLTTADVNSFSASIGFAVSGAPAGVTVGFTPTTIASPGAGTTTVSFTAASTTAAGTYSVTLKATGGGISQTTAIALTVASAPTFSIASSASTLSIVQGNSGAVTLTTVALYSFSGAVALKATGQPTGATVSFSPTSIASPGSGTSTMTVTVPSTVTAGSYTLTITGSGTSSGSSTAVSKTTTVALTVKPAPTFALTLSPTALSIAEGTSGTSTATIAGANSFSSAVALTLGTLPTGLTASLSSASISSLNSSKNTSGTSTLTVTAASSLAPGSYSFTVTATGGGVTKTSTVTVTVPTPAFTVAALPTSVSVVEGSSATTSISVAGVNSFGSAVTLAVTKVPTGLTASFSSASIAAATSSKNTSGSSTLMLAAASTLATGSYSVTIAATGGGVTKSMSIAVTVKAPPTFAMTLASSNVSVAEGGSASTTLSLAAQNSFSSAVALSVSNAPTGLTVSLSPTSIAAPGSGSTKITLSAASTLATGSYSVTIAATGGGISKSTTVAVTVVAPATFTLASSSSTLSMAQGGSSSTTFTIAGQNTFNSAVTLSASGVPTGLTASFSPASIAAVSSGSLTKGTSTLTVKAVSTLAAGSYSFLATASGGGVTQTTTVTVKVTTAAGLNVSLSSTSLTVNRGSSGALTIYTADSSAFSSYLSLMAISGTSNVGFSFSSNSTTSSGVRSTPLTITPAMTSKAGTYTISIYASDGVYGKTATFTLVVQ